MVIFVTLPWAPAPKWRIWVHWDLKRNSFPPGLPSRVSERFSAFAKLGRRCYTYTTILHILYYAILLYCSTTFYISINWYLRARRPFMYCAIQIEGPEKPLKLRFSKLWIIYDRYAAIYIYKKRDYVVSEQPPSKERRFCNI